MTKIQRAGYIINGLLMIAAGVLIAVYSEYGYQVLIGLLSLSLALSGIRTLVYYFTMARNMVGGQSLLYRGVMIFDFGVVSASLTSVPRYYIMIYLLGVHLFAGVIEVMRAFEAKRYEGASWKLKMSHGIVNILLAIFCLVFIKSTDYVIYIYCIGLVYSGIVNTVTACRKDAIVYVQRV